MTYTLRTKRLTLKPFSAADLGPAMELYQSPRAEFIGGPFAERDAWRLAATVIGHWQIHGFGMSTVTFAGSEEPLGIVGCWYPKGWPEREIGWAMFAEHEGKGIAFEAAQAVIDHAWNTLGWDTIVSYIDRDNARSIALAERLGAVVDPQGIPPKPDQNDAVYRHPKPERLAI